MGSLGLERILRLLGILVNNRRTTVELADVLDCDLRTVQRYLQVLKTVGFIIEFHSRGVPFINKSKGRLRDLGNLIHFSQEEAYLLHKAIDSIDDYTLLKQNLKRKLYSIYNFPELADLIVKPEQGEIVQNLLEAISNERSVVLCNYRSASSNQVSDRIIEPYQFTTNYYQVWGFEPLSGLCKLFNISRIGKVSLLEQKWQHTGKHLKTNVDVFRNSGTAPVGVASMRLNVRAMNLLTEEYPLAGKHIKVVDENTWIFEAEVFRFDGPARFALGLFENLEVLGDERFKKFVTDKFLSMKF